jgi:hypothetical protein
MDTLSHIHSVAITEDEPNIIGGDKIGRVMLQRWLNEPLSSGTYGIFHAEEHDLRDSESQDGSGAHAYDEVVSVGEGELSLGDGEGDASDMLGRWLDEYYNDGPFVLYWNDEYAMRDSGSGPEAAVEQNWVVRQDQGTMVQINVCLLPVA